jgi:hypothetical protein
MDKFEQCQHQLLRLVDGLAAKRHLFELTEALIDRYGTCDNAAEQAAMRCWLESELSGVLAALVDASHLESLNRKAVVMQTALNAFKKQASQEWS